MRRVIFSGVMLFLIIILSGCEEYSESQESVGSSITTQLVDDIATQEKEQEKAKEEKELKKQQAQKALITKQAEEIKKEKKKKTVSKCHSSYSGKCLKINAGDYDCAGGSGNGPNYTSKVKVVGYDEFGLDRDKDGYGCE